MSAERPPTVEDPQAPQWQRVHLWQIQSVRDLMMIAAFVGLIWLGYLLSIVTVPLLVALGLAYLVEPLVQWLSQKVPWLGRRGAVLSLMGVLGMTLALVLILTVPLVVSQATQLMKNSDRYLERARGFAADKDLPVWVQDGLGTLAGFLPSHDAPASGPVAEAEQSARKAAGTEEPAPAPTRPDDAQQPATQATVQPAPAVPMDERRVRDLVREELAKRERTDAVETAGDRSASIPSSALSTVASGSKQVVAFLGNLLGGIAGFAIFTLIMVFCFFYFSTAFPRVKESCANFIPAANRERTSDLVCKMDRAISGFVRGRLTICCVMGLIYAIGWTICGVPHAVLLGLAIGACGLVPYLSAIGLPIAWALLAVSLTGADDRHGFYFAGEGAQATIVWWKVLVFPLVVNVIAQLVEDYVLNPMIQGKATNLHPATILLACIAGGSLAGLYGMILAIPVVACIKILTTEVVLPRLQQWLAGRKQDPLPI